MTPYYEDALVTLHHGDCLDVLRELDDSSVDAVVTDPPYGISFMGKQWDQPGEFGSVRASTGLNHRRGDKDAALEAGKYDLSAHAMRNFQCWCEAWATECLRVLKPGGHLAAFGGARTWHRLANGIEDAGFEIRDSIAWLFGSGFPKSLNLVDNEGERNGLGTALKPAFEPIVIARKPLIGSVATNVDEHGTGALNIDACRIPTDETLHKSTSWNDMRGGHYGSGHRPGEPSSERRYTDRGSTDFAASPGTRQDPAGRWPANVVLDESQAAALDAQAPATGGAGRASGPSLREESDATVAYGSRKGWAGDPAFYGDLGGASRFFYTAKASADERPRVAGVAHPTVKPLELMRWLARLITPPGGKVLDLFAGSGTTGEACVLEGLTVILIEREAEYLPLIESRIARRRDPVRAVELAGGDAGLFGLLDGEPA